MTIKLVLFDLDETLVHATTSPLAFPHHFRIADYFVYIRPYALELVELCAARFDLAVWSSSSDLYVEAVTAELFGATIPVKFSWSVTKCVQRIDPQSNGYVYIKDLRKVRRHGYGVDEIIMIDDSPEKLQRQPTRHLYVPPFMGDRKDKALLDVAERIKTL